jgi:hypothetical protein
MNALARGLLVVVLVIGVLGFGAMGLCGGYFTLWAVTAQGAPFLVLSLPSLLGGFFMVWLCVQKIRRMLNQPTRQEDDPS